MILAIDVYYYNEKAKSVGVIFQHWTDALPIDIKTSYTHNILAYEPGNFYKRELPCILDLLATVNMSTINTIIIDGHVYVDNMGTYGLGGKLYEALQNTIPIVGIAKNAFASNNENTIPIQRGDSKKPIYVSAIGMDVHTIALEVQHMHGIFRMPTLLTILDQETRID